MFRVKFARFVLFFSVLVLSYPTEVLSQEISISQIDSLKKRDIVNSLLVNCIDSIDIPNVVVLLEKYNADPNFDAFDGVTPLMLAVQTGSYNLVSELLNHGADPNKVPYDGNTALIAASRYGLDSIAELLLSRKAKPNVANNQNRTPLHYAAYAGLPYLTDLLVYYGAKPDVSDDLGNTPLMLAVYSGALKTSEILLQSGTNPDIKDIKGRTPLMVAAQFNDTALCKQLLQYNANPQLCDNKGADAVNYAIVSGSSDVLNILFSVLDSDYISEKKYYQFSLEQGVTGTSEKLKDLGFYTKPKLSFTRLTFGTSTIFNGHEFLLDFSGGINERITRTTLFLEYLYRPAPVATLYRYNNSLYQFREKQKILSLSIVNKLPPSFRLRNTTYGIYAGGSINWIFRSVDGSSIDTKSLIRPSLKAGIYISGRVAEFYSGFDYIFYRRMGYLPTRYSIGLNFNVDFGSLKVIPKSVSKNY